MSALHQFVCPAECLPLACGLCAGLLGLWSQLMPLSELVQRFCLCLFVPSCVAAFAAMGAQESASWMCPLNTLEGPLSM